MQKQCEKAKCNIRYRKKKIINYIYIYISYFSKSKNNTTGTYVEDKPEISL